MDNSNSNTQEQPETPLPAQEVAIPDECGDTLWDKVLAQAGNK